ncbi:MAG TPA: aldo/keto reductase, partial [Caulobacteraceae bacterium]|nr:aldo/keto reductase [Caulobacteraceae bacterium]
VRYIGCSNWAAWRIAKALGLSDHAGRARFETVQAYYSIGGRDLEREMVPMMASEGVGLMVWSPLAGGFLSGKFEREGKGPQGARRTSFDFPPIDKERAWPIIDAMRGVAQAHDVSVARVALAYVLAKPWVTTVIIGARNTEQLEDNLAAADLTLTHDQLKHLDDVSALAPEYPGWMFARQGGNRVPKDFVKA